MVDPKRSGDLGPPSIAWRGGHLRRLLVTGGSGLVGGSVSSLALENWEVSATYLTNLPSLPGVDWRKLDVTEPESVEALVQALEPDLIVHTAAIADIDACEANPELAWSTNSLGTRYVAKAARTTGSRLIHLSTSNVFDGQKGDYSESDPTHGVNVYSRTKIASEQEVLKFEGCVVVRTSLVLGFPKPAGRSFLARAVLALRQGRSLLLPDDEIRSPIDSWTLASCILELGSQGEAGIYHIAGTERLSRYEMGLKIAHRIAADHSLVVPLQEICPDRAPRPADASLNTSKARNLLKTDLPDCGQAIDRAFRWADVGI